MTQKELIGRITEITAKRAALFTRNEDADALHGDVFSAADVASILATALYGAGEKEQFKRVAKIKAQFALACREAEKAEADKPRKHNRLNNE